MSVDRILASTLWMGQRLVDLARGRQTNGEAPKRADSPVGTLQSLFLERLNTHAHSDVELYKSATGPYPVERFHQRFRDRARALEVPVTIHFPRGVAPSQRCPVVVISPGLGAIPQATRFLEKHLASYGYLVIQPCHLGSDWRAVFTRTPLGAFTQRELLQRIGDIQLALSLLEQDRLPPHLTRRADPSRVALAGHSFGALTAQAMAGVPVVDKAGSRIPLRDDRFSAFVGMSPFGDSFPSRRLGFDIGSYHEFERPVLFMSGDKDDLFTLGKGPQTHLGPFQKVSSKQKYHVLIGNTVHADFSGLVGMIRKQSSYIITSTTLAFLDAILRECPEAKHYLERDLQPAVRRFKSWALTPTHSTNGRSSH